MNFLHLTQFKSLKLIKDWMSNNLCDIFCHTDEKNDYVIDVPPIISQMAVTFWTLQRTHVLLKFLVLGYPGWQGFWLLPQPSMMFSGSILLLFCLYPIYWYMTCRAGAQQMLLMWAETKMQASITTVVVITLTMRLSTICRWTWNPRISGILYSSSHGN